jgi:hypothetical protein
MEGRKIMNLRNCDVQTLYNPNEHKDEEPTPLNSICMLYYVSCPTFSMVLYMIGLGLGDEDDITVKGLKVRAVVAFFPFVVGIFFDNSH